MPGSAGGFWSYVHADDEADGGRIAQLARDVVAQFEMLTSETIDLFLDRDSLEWGEEWRAKVDSSLSGVAFFIPIITPRYFRSAECRRELQFFARKARALGVNELVMPLLYVDFPALHAENPDDDLVTLIRSFNWEDWTDLRFADPLSGEYRRGVVKLAHRLVSANAQAENTDLVSATQALERGGTDAEEEPGVLDRIASAEAAMPEWGRTLKEISGEIATVGSLAEAATAQMTRADQQGKGAAGRLAVARKLAQDLSGPSSRILTLGNDFTSQLHDIDSGIRAIIELAPDEVRSDPSTKEEACKFFAMVHEFSQSAYQALGMLQEMVDSIGPVERMSRDLRPVLRDLRQGLTLMVEGRAVSDEWVRLIDASPIQCPDN